jgi:hypothetical protein
MTRIYTVRTRYNKISYLDREVAISVALATQRAAARHLANPNPVFLTSTIGDARECADYWL